MEVHRPTYFNVPKNEAQVLDLSPGSDTPERKLKDLLLSDDEAAKVSAAVGMGGIGKTTDMCALGHDRHVWVKYHDGIWFIQLGQDATLDDLVDELYLLVDKVCSVQFAFRFSELLKRKRGAAKAILELVEELEKRNFLLIFDDVWEENEGYDIVKQIANAISASTGRLRMLISTRKEGVAHCPLTNSVVDVGPKDARGLVARRILCKHAQLPLDSLPRRSTTAGKAVGEVLDKCAGLPLALAVAGSTVHTYMKKTEDGEGLEESWIMLRKSLSTNVSRLGQEGTNEHQKGLFDCIHASMRLVECKWSTPTTETVYGLLSSLCIFPKQTWLPLETLQRTWGLMPKDVESFIEMLSDYSIASHVVRKGKSGLRVHDLVLEYCGQLAQEYGTTSEWHRRLVAGYCRDLDLVGGEVAQCVKVELRTDTYIRLNMVRHLLGCGMIDEAVQLVCDYRWVQVLNREEKRLPFQQCISDLKRIKQSISADTEVRSELVRGIELLLETMELGVFAGARTQSECSFQLYGRLSWLESAPELFARCLWSIERYGTGLWVKPSPGVLRAAGTSLKRILPAPFEVLTMKFRVEKEDLVLFGTGGEVAVMDPRDGIVRWQISRNDKAVTDWEIDEQTGEFFSSFWDGTVGVWREGALERQLHPFGEITGGWVTCMKLLPLNLIACGSNNGQLILMKTSTGDFVGTLNGHTDRISALATNEDGDMLISAAYDRTVQRWDMRSWLPLGDPLIGHVHVITCVALSPDGHIIASGSHDATLRLWDAQEGTKSFATLSTHQTAVRSVLFSRGGEVLVSGSENEILIWDVRTSQSHVSMKHKLLHDMDFVTSLCLSLDGEELYSTSKWTNEVSVWKTEAPKYTCGSNTLGRSFTSNIVFFGISPNGETMATYSKTGETMATCSKIGGIVDIRRVRDVLTGVENVLFSCRASCVHFSSQIAVSNDMQQIAYDVSSDVHSEYNAIFVTQMSTGKLLHKFRELSKWMSRPQGDSGNHISAISFDSEGLTITAEVRIWHLNQKWILKSMTWSTSTGRVCQTESDAPRAGTDAGNSRYASPLRCSKSHLWIKRSDSEGAPFGNEVLISDGSNIITAGTLDVAPRCSYYEQSAKRLWFSSRGKGLQFVELINGPVTDLETEKPSIPLIGQSPPPQASENILDPPASKSSSKYTVFISYSGPDKPLADWLYARLTEMGISVFAAKKNILPGQDYAKVMNDAMEHADIAIIIVSPEYPAKKWTMRELTCFQWRAHLADLKGDVGPTIIPLFFRMGARVCKSYDFMSTEDKQSERFKYPVLDAMYRLGSLQGIENPKGISNEPRTGQSEEDWKEELGKLLEEVVMAVCRELPKFDKGVVYARRAERYVSTSAGPSTVS